MLRDSGTTGQTSAAGGRTTAKPPSSLNPSAGQAVDRAAAKSRRGSAAGKERAQQQPAQTSNRSASPSAVETTRRVAPAAAAVRPLRLGFLGLGWIGRSRMKAIAGMPQVAIAAVADPNPAARQAALEVAPAAAVHTTLDELLREPLDGVVIATPSAQHAEQVHEAMRAGLPVFCQKPLARNSVETCCVVREAQSHNRLLGVDFSYRYVAGVQQMRSLIQSGVLGKMFAIDLVFHNAYGPDKSWFYDRSQSGGGCVIDLGIHMVDLARWLCGYPQASKLTSQLYAQGQPLRDRSAVEDAAFAQWMFDDSICTRLACSWKLSAGCDAVIRADFLGSQGAVSLYNVDGSFYRFCVAHHQGTTSHILATDEGTWGAGALTAWVQQLAASAQFDQQAYEYIETAKLIDSVCHQ